MKSRKEIEENKLKRKKHCPHCGEYFGMVGITQFFAKVKGNTLFCDVCQKESYVIASGHWITRYLIGFMCAIVGLVIPFVLLGFITASTYNPTDGTVRIFWWYVVGGFIASAAIARALYRIYHYFFGKLEIHKRFKDDLENY